MFSFGLNAKIVQAKTIGRRDLACGHDFSGINKNLL
jgi:hypothetical protein